MKKPMNRTRWQNAALAAVMLLTAAATWLWYGQQEAAHPVMVQLPMETTGAASGLSPMEQYRQSRDQTELRDLAALEAMQQNEQLAQNLREDAARRLLLLVNSRESQLAIEGALLESGLSPCVAVLTEGCLTIVTAAKAASAQEQARLRELAMVHAGVKPADIRVIFAAPDE